MCQIYLYHVKSIRNKPQHRNTVFLSLCILISDVAPLSAPAFSFCFPLLNATLRESSGSTEETENMMTRALQVINVHTQLRADTDNDEVAIDEVETLTSKHVIQMCMFVVSLHVSVQSDNVL